MLLVQISVVLDLDVLAFANDAVLAVVVKVAA